MSDARLHDHNIQIDRTNIVPETNDEFTGSWANKVAEQQIRAMGLGGSVIFQVPTSLLEDQLILSANVSLPFGWFGSTHPPMIWCMPQYGSVIVYKNCMDESKFTVRGANVVTADGYPRPYKMRSWVSELRHDGTQWQFKINHEAQIGKTSFGGLPNLFAAPEYVYPLRWMKEQWFPNITDDTVYPYWFAFGDQRPTNMALHWYCMGVDSSL